MKRFFSALVTLTLLAAPTLTSAAYASPGELIFSLSNEKPPADYNLNFYMMLAEPQGNEYVQVTASANGMTYGKSIQDAKMQGSFDWNIKASIEGEEVEASGKMEMRMVNQRVYARLSSFNAQLPEMSGPDKDALQMLQTQIGQWYYIDLIPFAELQGNQPQTLDDIVAQSSQQLQMEGVNISEQELRTIVMNVLNSLFTMEHSVVGGEDQYLLSLNENPVLRVVGELMNSSLATEDDVLSTSDYEEIAAIDSIINDSFIAKIKVRTDSKKGLTYAKQFFAIDYADEEFILHVGFEGEGKVRYTPVNVQEPANAISIEDTVNEWFTEIMLETQGFESLGSSGFEDDMWEDSWDPTYDDMYYDEPDYNDDYWYDEPVEWPEAVEVENYYMDPQYPNCDEEPGTARYLQLSRKGQCPMTVPNRTSIKGERR